MSSTTRKKYENITRDEIKALRNKFIKDIVKAAKRNQALNKPDTPSPNYESSYASNSFDTSTDQLHPTNTASSA